MNDQHDNEETDKEVAAQTVPEANDEDTAAPKKARKPKRESRAARWARLAGEAESLADDLASKLRELRDVQEEYENWRDAIEERFSGTATYEALSTICDIDIESAADEAETIRDTCGEASSAETPRMFGG